MHERKKDRLARYLEMIDASQESATLDELFQRVSDGEGLPKICSAWDVPYGKVLTWLMADKKKYEVYCRALEVAAHARVSEAIEIADERPGTTEKGATDAGAVAHARLRVDTRFRLAKYHAPERYGEKVVESGGVTIMLGEGTAKAALEMVKRLTLSVSVPPPDGVTIDVTPKDDDDDNDEMMAYG